MPELRWYAVRILDCASDTFRSLLEPFPLHCLPPLSPHEHDVGLRSEQDALVVSQIAFGVPITTAAPLTDVCRVLVTLPTRGAVCCQALSHSDEAVAVNLTAPNCQQTSRHLHLSGKQNSAKLQDSYGRPDDRPARGWVPTCGVLFAARNKQPFSDTVSPWFTLVVFGEACETVLCVVLTDGLRIPGRQA